MSAAIFYMIIKLEMSSILEFSYPPAGLDLYIFPPKSLHHLSVHLSDFVAGVPKGPMLYGSVRKFNHHSHFGFHSGPLRMGDLGFRLGTDTGK